MSDSTIEKKIDQIDQIDHEFQSPLKATTLDPEFQSRLKALIHEPENLKVEEEAKASYEEGRILFGCKPTDPNQVTRWRCSVQLNEQMYAQTIIDHRRILKERVINYMKSE